MFALMFDAAVTLIAAAVALAVDEVLVGFVASGWLSTMCVVASRHGRVADLLDRRHFRRLGVNYVLMTTTAAVLLGDLRDVRLTGAAAVLPVVLTLIVRETLSMPAVRRLLGTEGSESVLIVGTAESASRTVRELLELPHLHLVGVCLSASEAARTEVEGVPVLGTVSDAPALAASMPLAIVAVHDVDKLGGLQLARFNWGLETTGTQISIVTPLTNTACERLTVRRLGRRLVVDVQHSKPSGLIAQLKHAVERLLAGLILILTLPVIVLAALAVKITSPGSAIFKQIRVREYGSTFTMYKLRTMFLGAEARLPEFMEHNEVGGGLFKLKADPRVTRVGRWLRMLSIDELPQLVNVLKGDMSLIGPRPALPHEVATYEEQALRRLAVKPGLTGLWQVSGRSNLSWDDSVRLDTDYVDNWRAARDVSIAIRTIKAILRREGAH